MIRNYACKLWNIIVNINLTFEISSEIKCRDEKSTQTWVGCIGARK